MPDLFAWWQQDLVILPDGDLLIADGTIEGEQRVLRRLLTNPGDYIWHLEYGAGLPRFVGDVEAAPAIASLAMASMLVESAVAQSPLPVVNARSTQDGYMRLDIKYVDADTGQLVTLGFNVNE